MSKSKSRHRKSTPTAAPTPSRRDVLKLGRSGAIGLAALAGAGYWGFGSFRAYAAEHDLTRVGEGAMTIVQIHDPQCPTCTALQKQTRAALRDFDECGVTYLVADIKTPEGAAFARKYRVPHVTLLMFDGQGDLHRTVRGLQTSTHLAEVFAAHKAAVT
ncbi:hypothetical protein [uncultured Tateyamaria sp.]|uniref:hypothetical protein n=1 Tax=uncultured Tateyamaria sp. TaxID=455651 RepID=UPI002613C07C|nr:hypothetical protein [uncultured Tateyamaria sp.]